ncbi:MAG: hypothetical protein ABIB47_02555 [Candidatus Woesearchaeota archaeon]
MINTKLIGLFCIFLVITLPFSIAQTDNDNQNDNEASTPVGAGELNIGYIGPETKEEFKEDTFYSDLIININRYEPTVLTTNLVEEQNTPVYIFLSALPSINLGNVPRITSMDVAVVGGDTQYVARDPQYNPPPVYTYEDIGYITTWIKRIPKEQDVPKKIDLDLKARIRFEGEATAPVLGGEQRKIFSETRSRTIFSEGRFVDPQFSVFGGRGYLRPAFISSTYAVFYVYGQDGVRIGSIRAAIGQESESVSLIPESNFVEDQLRVRVERIISERENNVEFEINGIKETYSKGNEIQRTGWFVEDVFVPNSTDQSASFVYLVRKDYAGVIEGTAQDLRFTSPEYELVLVFEDGQSYDAEKLKDWYEDFYGSNNLVSVLGDRRTLDPKLSELGINSIEASRFLYKRIPTLGENEFIENVVEEPIEDFKASFNNEFPIITKVEKGKEPEAELIIRGRTDLYEEGYQFEGSLFDSCIDTRTNKEIYCEIQSIDDDSVTISYPTRGSNNECTGTSRETLDLNREYIDEGLTKTATREQGTQDILPRTTINIIGDTLSSEKCGVPIELTDIETHKQVEVTILAGQKRGYTESLFKLHIPIEKRAINISIDELDKKIEETQKLIEDLDGLIEKLEKFVSTWSKVCLGVSAWFTLEAFLVGLPKYKKGAGPEDTTYDKEFTDQQYYSQAPKKGDDDGYIPNENSRIYSLQDGEFIGKDKDGNPIPLSNQNFVYNKEGEQLVWDPIQGNFVPEPRLTGSDERSIKVYSGEGGKQKLVFGVDDKNKAIKLARTLGNSQMEQQLKELLQDYSDHGYYFVYDQGDSVTLWQKRGNEIDFQERGISGELDDLQVPFIAFKTGGSAEQRFFYKKFEDGLDRVRSAQIRGQRSAFFGGNSYNINDMGKLNTAKFRCEDVLGSKQKCSILFNACDPVVCPRSRCTLGGHYTQTGPSGVIGSGLVGSLVLCLPNIHPDNGGVLVPICLSGILASLKGIRSHLQTYKQCLEKQKLEGVVEGTCDKIRSIFLCQLIWRETIVLLQAKAGLMNLFNNQGAGGGDEYFTQGIGGSVEQANEVVGFLVNDYADDVLAAYRGKGLAEIGAEVCKASIAQRIPFLDALVQEFATPANPPQFTAYFEEAPYAPTLGKSLYSVYLHIYAGTPQREGQGLNYVVFLKSFGSSPRLMVDSGSLSSEQSADKNIDLIGDMSYQEICVVINGLEQCGFGRAVSSSFLISGLDDYLAGIDLAKNIETAAQCKAEPTAPVTYTLQTGALPFARVRRVCAPSNPGLGLGEENSWRNVGSCGKNQQGISLGHCWEFGDLSRYPETERLAMDLGCNNGEICEANQKCNGHPLRQDSRGRVCCTPVGSCEDIEAYQFALNSIKETEISESQLNKLVKEYNANQINEKTPSLTEEEGYALGTHFCSQKKLTECEAFFNTLRPEYEKYSKAYLILGLIYFELNNLDKAKRFLEMAEKKKEQLNTDDKKRLEDTLKSINEKLEKEDQRLKTERQFKALEERANNLLTDTTSLATTYDKFGTIKGNLTQIKGNLTTIKNSIKVNASEARTLVNTNFEEITTILTPLDIKEDAKYKEIETHLTSIKTKIDSNGARNEIETDISNLKQVITNSIGDITERRNLLVKLDEAKTSLITYSIAANKINEAITLLERLQDPITRLKDKITELKADFEKTNETPQ